MRTTTILIIVTAVFAGLLAAFMVKRAVKQPDQTAGTKIVVATKNLNYGAVIADADLAELPWTSPEFPEGAFHEKSEILKEGSQSRYLLSNIPKSTPITTSHLTEPGQKPSLSAMIADGKTAVTVRVDDVRGVAGFTMPGDRVDVVMTRTDPATRDGYADTILRSIKVLAIDQLSKERQDAAQVAKSVTLEVTPVEGEKLRLASEVGTLSLTLRHSDDSNSGNVQRITTADLTSATDSSVTKKTMENIENDKPKSRMSVVRIIKSGKIEQMNVISE